MGFLREILERPENERPFLLIPVGYPAEDADVPALLMLGSPARVADQTGGHALVKCRSRRKRFTPLIVQTAGETCSSVSPSRRAASASE